MSECVACGEFYKVLQGEDSGYCSGCDPSGGGTVNQECVECGEIIEIELAPGEAARDFEDTICQRCNDRNQGKLDWDLGDDEDDDDEDDDWGSWL